VDESCLADIEIILTQHGGFITQTEEIVWNLVARLVGEMLTTANILEADLLGCVGTEACAVSAFVLVGMMCFS